MFEKYSFIYTYPRNIQKYSNSKFKVYSVDIQINLKTNMRTSIYSLNIFRVYFFYGVKSSDIARDKNKARP